MSFFSPSLAAQEAAAERITKLESDLANVRAALVAARDRHLSRVIAASAEWPAEEVRKALAVSRG